MLEKIKKIIQPILEQFDVNLYDLVYEQENQENFLRILIEKDDLSMDLETCVLVSEQISPALDLHDLIKEDYFLEVASPGLDRLLKQEEYIKAIDKYVLVKYSKEDFKGILKEVTETEVKVQINLKGRLKLVPIKLVEIKEMYLTTKF